MSDFNEEFSRMLGKREPDPPTPEQDEATPTPEAEPEHTPEQDHTDLLNELLAGKARREQRLVDLFHPKGDEAA